MLVNSGGKFQPLKIIPIVIPTRIYTAAGTVRLEHVYSIPRLSGAKTITIGPGKEASSPHIYISIALGILIKIDSLLNLVKALAGQCPSAPTLPADLIDRRRCSGICCLTRNPSVLKKFITAAV